MTTNKELRGLAEKAGSGYWYEAGELLYHDSRSGEAHGLHHDEDGFIVAASPATVLSLLDENEALQAENEKLRKDAERLQWVTENWFYQTLDGTWIFSFDESWDAGKHLDLRAAIDSAMEKKA